MRLFWGTIVIMTYRPYRFFNICYERYGLLEKQRNEWGVLYTKACKKIIGKH